MIDRDKLGLLEYTDVLLDNVSKMVISQSYIDENRDFFDNVIFKLWESYINSLETVSIVKHARYLEIFVGTMLRCKPSLELPEDSINLF